MSEENFYNNKQLTSVKLITNNDDEGNTRDETVQRYEQRCEYAPRRVAHVQN